MRRVQTLGYRKRHGRVRISTSGRLIVDVQIIFEVVSMGRKVGRVACQDDNIESCARNCCKLEDVEKGIDTVRQGAIQYLVCREVAKGLELQLRIPPNSVILASSSIVGNCSKVFAWLMNGKSKDKLKSKCFYRQRSAERGAVLPIIRHEGC